MSKSLKKISVMLVIALLVSICASLSTFADDIKGESFNLIDEKSGYKIIVPNFVEIKKVKIESEEAVFEGNVIVMEMPQKNSEGAYTIFEVITTDKKAKTMESYPSYINSGQMGTVYGDFSSEGRFTYNLRSEVNIKDAYNFNFDVYDKDGKNVFKIYDLNFMFVTKGKDSATVKENTTLAKPTASKVMVNGKDTSFEAYNINGNNFFKLRDLAMAVNGTDKNFEVGFDGTKNAINLISKKTYTPSGGELVISNKPVTKNVLPTTSKVYLDGNEIQFVVYNIGGNNYFKLRDITKVINIGVTFDSKTSTIGIDTKSEYTEE